MLFGERLATAARNGHLCIGLDPVPDRLPGPLREDRNGVTHFLQEIVRLTAPFAAAYKPNLAFFEALGDRGEEALHWTIEAVRLVAPHAIVIGDGKRGDIGSTAERYAHALFERWRFDAVTVNPYFGTDGVIPFLARPEKGAFLLAATSNPSAVEVQHPAADVSLPAVIARLARDEWNENRNVGLVVGATRGAEMERLRAESGDLPWLIPGIGAQGGDLADAVRHGIGAGGIPSLINVSRSVLYASDGDDFAEAAAVEAERLRDAISGLLPAGV
ncbi:MAG: Orotidine 5'-phosphate decarboxylase [Calditrichaeota bacterium]|nr:Orotidine 5'-phosphate decarboxylase [Calditrichota bacterium]